MRLKMHASAASQRDIAAHLNGLGYRSPRGSEWTACTVQRVLMKLTA